MKPLILALCLAFATAPLAAQDLALPAPAKTGGLPLMEALSKRSSARSYDGRELSPQQLANLLWAAFGINRPDGKRTAPSANNRQELQVYVLLSKGAFVYDAQGNRLRRVAEGDLRPAVGRAETAAAILIYVGDLAKRTEPADRAKNVACIDSAFAAQNVYLYCASEGLATVYRGGFDKAALTPKLALGPTQEILAVQPVGFPKG